MMKHLALILTAVAVTFASPSIAVAAKPSADVAQIEALEAAFVRAFNHKDVDAVMRGYAPGNALFVFDFVGPPSTYEGKAAYRKDWVDFFASFKGPLRFAISDLDVTVSGDVGWGRSLQHFVGTDAASGKKVDIVARVTDVYRKINGRWLVVQEHVSVPLDLKTMNPVFNASLRQK